MATYRELKAQAESLLQEAEDLRKEEISTAIEEIRIKMAEYDIGIDDLRTGPSRAATKGRSTSGKKAPIKFRDSKGNTWSGRGLKPKWLQAALATGKKVEDFAV